MDVTYIFLKEEFIRGRAANFYDGRDRMAE